MLRCGNDPFSPYPPHLFVAVDLLKNALLWCGVFLRQVKCMAKAEQERIGDGFS